MTKLFNFIIFLIIIYLFFNMSVSQFEKFTNNHQEFTISDIPISVDHSHPFKKPVPTIVNPVIGPWDNIPREPIKHNPKVNKRAEAVVEDDHYNQEVVVDLNEVDSDINISDIISDIEGRSVSDNSCGIKLSTTKPNADTDCDSKTIDNWKVNKPAKEVFDVLTKETDLDFPTTIKDIYNKMVTPEKGTSFEVKTQGQYTMNTDSNKYTTLKGQEKIVTQLTNSLHANDPNYDSYSKFD